MKVFKIFAISCWSIALLWSLYNITTIGFDVNQFNQKILYIDIVLASNLHHYLLLGSFLMIILTLSLKSKEKTVKGLSKSY